jgi:hypothetical protein
MVSRTILDERIAASASIAEDRDTKGRKPKKADKVEQGGCYCRPEKRASGRKGKSSAKICKCGFKCRGKNHEAGTHHRQGKPKK